MSKIKTWFITGTSKGLGLSLVKTLLDQGENVAATTRNIEALKSNLSNTDTNNLLPLEVDLTDDISISNGIDKCIDRFKGIDVLINNAGYGIGGSVEEVNTDEIMKSFEINFFAALKVIKNAVPHLRQQRSGHIINISSIAGFAPGIGWPLYAASKYALSGLSEGLALDLKEFGINVTAVDPGAFRTEFLTQNSLVMSATIIEDYKAVRDSHQKYQNMNGVQAGDPEKAAEALIKLANHPSPPSLLFLGEDAFNRANDKIESIKTNMQAWESWSKSTNF